MTPAEQNDAGGRALRVLLMDGDEPARDRLRGILEGDGMTVSACAEPPEACQGAGEFMPDLLLARLAPGSDVAELATVLRRSGALANVVIVFLAGGDDAQSRFQAIAAGADDFLVDPIAPPELISAVRARVRRARMQARRMPAADEPLRRGGQLRRDEFLAQLGGALRDVSEPWQVLIAVSVDQSRSIVEALGHAGAFELEQSIAMRFEEVLREDDAQTLWMEFGFGILAKRGSREEIEALAREICSSAARSPFDIRGKQYKLTLSVGVALPPPGPEPGGANRWFASAYAAQAIAHRLGGNRYDGVLTREYGDMPAERVLIIREWAKEAVAGDNVLIEFQPILPLRPKLPGLYLVDTKLRDYRAPLAGVKRREYLALARSAGALTMIDRMSLFSAFEAIEEERAQDRTTRLLVSVDLATMNEEQLVWMDAEVRRRKAHSEGLIIEFDADAALGNLELVNLVQRLEDMGIVIAISDDSGNLERIDRLQRLPAGFLRLPISAIDSVPPQLFANRMTPWRGSGRGLIVGQVESFEAVARLLEMKIDYVLGDALAGSGPRLDYEFTQVDG